MEYSFDEREILNKQIRLNYIFKRCAHDGTIT
jgi:hypothetical protein